jgi:hypothetical protein
MGNTQPIQKVNYEDMQTAVKNPEIYLIINTLCNTDQGCLILNTTCVENEEPIINKYMKENKGIRIIIYGKNCNDDTINKKYQQLVSIGFTQVYLYVGGLFEWLMLQDIYGDELFPTNKKQVDLLKYKPNAALNISLIEY